MGGLVCDGSHEPGEPIETIKAKIERLRSGDRVWDWEPLPLLSLAVTSITSVSLYPDRDGWHILPVQNTGEHAHRLEKGAHAGIVQAMLEAEAWATQAAGTKGAWLFVSALARRHRQNGLTWTTLLYPDGEAWGGHVVTTPAEDVEAVLASHQHHQLARVVGLREACAAADLWRPGDFKPCPCPDAPFVVEPKYVPGFLEQLGGDFEEA